MEMTIPNTKIILHDDKEQTFTLYVGGRDESDAYNYVQTDGSKMVNTMTKETVNNILNIEE